MYMTPIVFITLACLRFSRSSEDEENGRIQVHSAIDRVVDIVQNVVGHKPVAESTAVTDGSLISQPGGPTESLSSTAGAVTPDYAIVNPAPIQSSGSNVKVPESGCGCSDYIREFCEGL